VLWFSGVALERFPSNMVGIAFGFRAVDFFRLDESEAAAARKAPQVKF
jgi:hypothetical protein